MYRDILEEHVEEAAILWGLRKSAIHSVQYALEDLAGIDERIDAHLFALFLAGDEGFGCALEMWDGEAPDPFFVMAYHAFRKAMPREIENVSRVGEESSELAKEIIAALGRLSDEEAAGHIRALLASGSVARRRIGIAAGVPHGMDLEVDIAAALMDPGPYLRSLVVDAIGESGRWEFRSHLAQELLSEDREVRFSAWRSSMLLGDGSALSLLDGFVESDEYRDRAIGLAVRRMAISDAHEWLAELARNENHLPAAIRGFGVLGDPSAVPFLLNAMRFPGTAKAAGEAFSMMTGLDEGTGEGYFRRDRPDGEDAAVTAGRERSAGDGAGETGDEGVDEDSDGSMWPEPDRIALWWEENKIRFRAGVRHLLGEPISQESLQYVLRKGNQVMRAAAAIEIVMTGSGRALFDVRAHGGRQQRLLGIR
ncbi:MAG: TIGR02270 family protein [Deltaproteobacteria bacterium]